MTEAQSKVLESLWEAEVIIAGDSGAPPPPPPDCDRLLRSLADLESLLIAPGRARGSKLREYQFHSPTSNKRASLHFLKLNNNTPTVESERDLLSTYKLIVINLLGGSNVSIAKITDDVWKTWTDSTLEDHHHTKNLLENCTTTYHSNLEYSAFSNCRQLIFCKMPTPSLQFILSNEYSWQVDNIFVFVETNHLETAAAVKAFVEGRRKSQDGTTKLDVEEVKVRWHDLTREYKRDLLKNKFKIERLELVEKLVEEPRKILLDGELLLHVIHHPNGSILDFLIESQVFIKPMFLLDNIFPEQGRYVKTRNHFTLEMLRDPLLEASEIKVVPARLRDILQEETRLAEMNGSKMASDSPPLITRDVVHTFRLVKGGEFRGVFTKQDTIKWIPVKPLELKWISSQPPENFRDLQMILMKHGVHSKHEMMEDKLFLSNSPPKFPSQQRHCILSGESGSGKTTVLRCLAIKLVNQCLIASLTTTPKSMVLLENFPEIIPHLSDDTVGKLSGSKVAAAIATTIIKQHLIKDCDYSQVVHNLVNFGDGTAEPLNNVFLFLDGLDEVGYENLEKCFEALQLIHKELLHVSLVVTCRPCMVLRLEAILTTFAHHLEQLTDDEVLTNELIQPPLKQRLEDSLPSHSESFRTPFHYKLISEISRYDNDGSPQDGVNASIESKIHTNSNHDENSSGVKSKQLEESHKDDKSVIVDAKQVAATPKILQQQGSQLSKNKDAKSLNGYEIMRGTKIQSPKCKSDSESSSSSSSSQDVRWTATTHKGTRQDVESPEDRDDDIFKDFQTETSTQLTLIKKYIDNWIRESVQLGSSSSSSTSSTGEPLTKDMLFAGLRHYSVQRLCPGFSSTPGYSQIILKGITSDTKGLLTKCGLFPVPSSSSSSSSSSSLLVQLVMAEYMVAEMLKDLLNANFASKARMTLLTAFLGNYYLFQVGGIDVHNFDSIYIKSELLSKLHFSSVFKMLDELLGEDLDRSPAPPSSEYSIPLDESLKDILSVAALHGHHRIFKLFASAKLYSGHFKDDPKCIEFEITESISCCNSQKNEIIFSHVDIRFLSEKVSSLLKLVCETRILRFFGARSNFQRLFREAKDRDISLFTQALKYIFKEQHYAQVILNNEGTQISRKSLAANLFGLVANSKLLPDGKERLDLLKLLLQINPSAAQGLLYLTDYLTTFRLLMKLEIQPSLFSHSNPVFQDVVRLVASFPHELESEKKEFLERVEGGLGGDILEERWKAECKTWHTKLYEQVLEKVYQKWIRTHAGCWWKKTETYLSKDTFLRGVASLAFNERFPNKKSIFRLPVHDGFVKEMVRIKLIEKEQQQQPSSSSSVFFHEKIADYLIAWVVANVDFWVRGKDLREFIMTCVMIIEEPQENISFDRLFVCYFLEELLNTPNHVREVLEWVDENEDDDDDEASTENSSGVDANRDWLQQILQFCRLQGYDKLTELFKPV